MRKRTCEKVKTIAFNSHSLPLSLFDLSKGAWLDVEEDEELEKEEKKRKDEWSRPRLWSRHSRPMAVLFFYYWDGTSKSHTQEFSER